MLNRIMIGRYYPISSPVHHMNPVAKLLSMILYIITIFLCKDIKLMLLLTLVVFMLYELAHLPRKIYFKTLFSLKFILLFILVIYYLMGYGLEDVILVCLRLYVIVLYTTILTLTTPTSNITYALKTILTPLKLIGIPVNKMAFSISLALRFIPTIMDQASKIMKSQASRGIDYYSSNLAGKFLAIKTMLLPMFILTIRRADTLSESMQMRLYDINGKRSSLKRYKWTLFETFIVFMHIGLMAIVIARMVIK